MHQVNTKSIPSLLDDSMKPNWYSQAPMPDKEQPRSIRFPQSLWDAIDRDAVRCKRSAVKQMEAVLGAYYALNNVDLDAGVMDAVRAASGLTIETVNSDGTIRGNAEPKQIKRKAK